MNRESFTRRLVAITLFILWFTPFSHAFGSNSIQCHCFTNRVYNPAARFEADDYILATSFNSLLARVAGIPKKNIVMLKMGQGVSQDDLLIGLKVARVTGQPLAVVIEMRQAKSSWHDIIGGLEDNGSGKQKNNEILSALTANQSEQSLAAGIADEFIAGFYRLSRSDLDKLRSSGLGAKETNLALVLHHFSEIEPAALAEQYLKQGRSWSEIAYNLGVTPKEAGRLVMAYPTKDLN